MDKKRTRLEWAALLREWETSGLTRSEFCRKHNIKCSTFDYWRRQLRVDKNVHGFVKIKKGPVSSQPPHFSMRVSTGGYTIEFMRGVPADEVRAVLQMCRELS